MSAWDRFAVRTTPTRLGDGQRPEVNVTMSKVALNDLSTLLLSLPDEQFERWRVLHHEIDAYLAGYNFLGKRVDDL